MMEKQLQATLEDSQLKEKTISEFIVSPHHAEGLVNPKVLAKNFGY
jgi:hypothetical protein